MISDKARAILIGDGRRRRVQRGHVKKSAGRWRGYYYSHEIVNGERRRVHRSADLGPASLTKGAASAKLAEIIAGAAGNSLEPVKVATVGWFFEERFLPLYKSRWKGTHATRTEYIIRRYVVEPFASIPLVDVGRFHLQKRMNELAEKYSGSVVAKFRTWAGALFNEAVDQDFIQKSPARRLTAAARPTTRRALSLDEVAAIAAEMSPADELILRLYLVTGLRARELFALRGDDIDLLGCRVRVDESLSERGEAFEPKTRASVAWCSVSASMAEELSTLARGPRDWLFPSSVGTPKRAEHWRERALKPAANRAGVKGATIQALRRTTATLMHYAGGADLKSIQSQMRHASPNITAEVYIQADASKVRAAAEDLDKRIRKKRSAAG